MVERRSLGDAMMSPEKMAFISGGEAKKTLPVEKVKDIQPSIEVSEDAKPSERRSRTRSRSSREEQEPEASDLLDELLVSRTARFQYRTAQALTRAHLERKLKRLRPTTQQEIIEIAVQAWLRDHGYLD
jgi:hypothetical protein